MMGLHARSKNGEAANVESRPRPPLGPDEAPASSEPLLILGPPRSFTSVVSAMLGQHPQMFGLPELHLFVASSVSELFYFYSIAGDRRRDGLLRAIAEVFMEKQNVATVQLAKRWLEKNPEVSTADIFKKIVDRVHPRILVEKSVTTVWRQDYLQRAAENSPNARYLHIVRHPRPQGESMMEAFDGEKGVGRHMLDYGTKPPTIDPQVLWYNVHHGIVKFLETIPEERKIRVRGEDILSEPDEELRKICQWLGVRDDDEAIEEMKHPENSPFSTIGPVNAPFGSDPKFLKEPALRPARAMTHSLEGALSWRKDGAGFTEEVRELSRIFGYA